MKKRSSKLSGKKTLGRLVPGFLKSTERSHPGEPPNLIPTGAPDPALAQPGPSTVMTAPSTAATFIASTPTAVEHSGAVLDRDGEEEREPPALAKSKLNKAGEDLKKKIPADFLGSMSFEIKASADITTLADSIGSALVMMMDRRSVGKSRQTHFQGLVTEWAKKTIPFIETGLTAANV